MPQCSTPIVYPLGQQKKTNVPITLIWSNQWADQQLDPSTLSYTVQISRNSNFSSVDKEISVSNGICTCTFMPKFSQSACFFRVRANRISFTSSEWSTMSYPLYIVQRETISPFYPNGGSHASGYMSITFKWKLPVAHSLYHPRCSLKFDTDINFSAPHSFSVSYNNNEGEMSFTPTWTWTANTYYWKVCINEAELFNNYLLSGPWSENFQFDVINPS